MSNPIRDWNIHQKRALYDMCIIGEQMIHSKIDYLDIITALGVELKQLQESYIQDAQVTTAEVPVS